VLDVGAIDGSS